MVFWKAQNTYFLYKCGVKDSWYVLMFQIILMKNSVWVPRNIKKPRILSKKDSIRGYLSTDL